MPKNIIKSQTIETFEINRRNLLKSRVLEAQQESARIISEAQENAARITENARREAEMLRELAYEEGREKAVSEFSQAITDAYEKRERISFEIEQDLIKLSIKLAEKIIGREIQMEKATIADIVSTALRHVRQQERLIVRVNPNDFSQIEGFETKIVNSGRAQFLDFDPDPKVESGGCIIESEVGTVDARLQTQLKILERLLLKQTESDVTEE